MVAIDQKTNEVKGEIMNTKKTTVNKIEVTDDGKILLIEKSANPNDSDTIHHLANLRPGSPGYFRINNQEDYENFWENPTIKVPSDD